MPTAEPRELSDGPASRPPICFHVPGHPVTQGSKQPFVPTYKDGEPVRRHRADCPLGGGRATGCGCPIFVNVVEDNAKELGAWRDSVRWVARATMRSTGPLDGCLAASFMFLLRRPAGHYGTGRNERVLKRDAPAAPCVVPDVGKLTRAVEDAMTGIVYTDDSRIVSRFDAKRYVHHWEEEGVDVRIARALMQTVGDLIAAGEMPTAEEEAGQLGLSWCDA